MIVDTRNWLRAARAGAGRAVDKVDWTTRERG